VVHLARSIYKEFIELITPFFIVIYETLQIYNSGVMASSSVSPIETGFGPTIRSFIFDDFVERVRGFHGFAAVGVIIGGFMVDLAYRHLPSEGLFDALCETPKCLPDAIQLLTPCTIGNGWLTVTNVGRYALTLYDKETGEGVRVFVDPARVDVWPEIKNWFFKLKPKKEQDNELLMRQVRDAGSAICGVSRVRVDDGFLQRRHRGSFAVCPQCREAYPVADGSICLPCRDGHLYAEESRENSGEREAL
jgi:formylmethanofuran dehydrogenase subunit E